MIRRSASPSTATTPADDGAARFPAGDYRRPGETTGEAKSPEEAHRQRLLREARRKPLPWQPSFEMEDFGSPPASACSEKLAGEEKKRERETGPLAGGGEREEDPGRKKKAAAMGTMKWDLNKRDESSDDN
ncbi:unnamed protein product [Spirodela intermedia]|uniref:Uncharacterized protein n=1 Tax=Spirodela intermedia TaxID=51605 RepID=A0A7I8IK90_SPIIN|nr:unnamed protein product [Spirodela intermedia]CAA6657924.1 unnamed protein product [Spirodela intermedia]